MVCSSFYDKENVYNKDKYRTISYNLQCYNKFVKFINYKTNKHKYSNLISSKLFSLYSRYNLKDY